MNAVTLGVPVILLVWVRVIVPERVLDLEPEPVPVGVWEAV